MQSKRHLPLLVLLLAVCLVYANSFDNGFHFDDFHAVVDNPAIRSLHNVRRIFTDATAFSVLPANQTYRPVVTASLALDYALAHGYGPFWFHLRTLCWFLLRIVLLFLTAEIVFERSEENEVNAWLALGVAAWFGLHPAMAETVNYVIQRGDVYCTLGCVAALWIFARYRTLRRYGLYLLPFTLAMLSKPPSAVFPALLLLYVFFFEGQERTWKERGRKALVAILPALTLTTLLLWLQSRLTPKSFLPSTLSAADYRLTQPYVWWRYCKALIFPLHLNIDTDLQPFHGLSARAVEGLLFVALLVGVAGLASLRQRTYPIAFGLLWFVITQLPTSLYPLSEVENDHRMFLSFPGLMIAVVWGLRLGYGRVIQKGWIVRSRALRPVLASLAVCVLCAYAYGAHKRNLVWRTEDSLWADDVAKSPQNGRGLMNYGLSRMNAGDYTAALKLFDRALTYTPNYPTLEINLGVANGALAAERHPELRENAEEHFRRALALAPMDDATHAFFGRWLLGQGRLAEARQQLEIAVSLNPERPMQRGLLLKTYEQAGDSLSARKLARETLALLPGDPEALAVLEAKAERSPQSAAALLIDQSLQSYRGGRYQESIDEAQQALKLNPHSAEAWNNIGAGYGGLREWDQAIAAEQEALRLNPDLQIAKNNLRWFSDEKSGKGTAQDEVPQLVELSMRLNQQGNYEGSLSAAKKAIALDPRSAEAWNNVAADYESLHRWDEAIAAARKAVAIKPDFQLAKNNLAWSLQQKAAAKP